MTDLFTLDDLAKLVGPIPDPDKPKYQGLIDIAVEDLETEFQARGLDMAHELEQHPYKRGLVRKAIRNAVWRVHLNPDGYRQASVTEGPYTKSWTLDTVISSGALYLSDQDLAALFPDMGSMIGNIRIQAGLA